MMWIEHVNNALKRGKSCYGTSEVTKWIMSGEAVLFVGDQMTASARPFDGKCQVVHVGGKWNSQDVNWFRKRLRARMRQWDVDSFVDEGRSGWPRFLRMKGFEL